MAAVKHRLLLVLAVAVSIALFPGCAPREAPPAEPAGAAAPAPPAESAPQPEAAAPAPAAAGDPVAAMTEPPAMPKGYGSSAEVMVAIGNGDIALLDENPPVPEGVKEIAGLEYCNIDGTSLKLDLALPAEGEGPFPGLIFIHGGAWVSGEREIYHLYTYHFAQQGYAAATISYRLSGQAKFPAAVQDVKCAVRWMRANAATYNIDPGNIALIGGSAGGHLAMMVGYTPDVPEFEGEGGNPGVSSAVQAVVNFYRPMTTAEIAEIGRCAGLPRRDLGREPRSASEGVAHALPERGRSAHPDFPRDHRRGGAGRTVRTARGAPRRAGHPLRVRTVRGMASHHGSGPAGQRTLPLVHVPVF